MSGKKITAEIWHYQYCRREFAVNFYIYVSIPDNN